MKSENPTMLVVDDEIEILKMFRDIFQPRGWRVFTAPTGTLGLANVEKEKIDIVLLDIRLPDISGIEILKKIKKTHPGLPVIVVTAFGYKDDLVTKALSFGAAGYVSKGVSITELMGVIDNTLAK